MRKPSLLSLSRDMLIVGAWMVVPSNDAATSPHEGNPSVVELPTELFGCFSHQHESLSVRHNFGGVKSFPYLKNNVWLFSKPIISLHTYTVPIASTDQTITLDPTCNMFGYNEHPAIMSNFFSLRKEHFWVTSIYKKRGYNEYRLQRASFCE